MSISNEGDQNRISTTTSIPTSETDKSTDKPTVRVEQNVKRQTDINPPKKQSEQIDLSSRTTTKVAQPKTFVNQGTNTVSQTSNTEKNKDENNIDTFCKDMTTITDQTEKALSKKIPTKKLSLIKRIANSIKTRNFFATAVVAAITGTVIAACPPLAAAIAGVVLTTVVTMFVVDIGLRFFEKEGNNISPRKLDKMASSHRTASLTAGIFDNDEVKEKLKENQNYKDVDFNLVTQNVKKSLKNPKVLKAMHNFVNKSRTALFNKKDKQDDIEKKLVENTEDFLDVFFASVDESLIGKEQSFIQDAKKEYLKAFIETDPQKFKNTILKTLNASEVFKMVNISQPKERVLNDRIEKVIESIRRGMGNYMQKHFDQDTRL
jgi:ElaB/YqjD/DUF883 family membrane-anchored ribosome-binding protein